MLKEDRKEGRGVEGSKEGRKSMQCSTKHGNTSEHVARGGAAYREARNEQQVESDHTLRVSRSSLKEGRMEGRTDGWKGGQTNGRMGKEKDGRTKENKETCKSMKFHIYGWGRILVTIMTLTAHVCVIYMAVFEYRKKVMFNITDCF